jgi:hypothetical protein
MVKHYTENNSPQFPALLSVKERIPDLVKEIGIADMGKLLMAEIAKFINCYTIIRPMNPDQIAQCAYAIISSSEEDYLSLQDLVLFFEGAKQGKYGRVLDHIDQHVIFEMLEVYRQSRHVAYLNLKDEKETQFKANYLPRLSEEKEPEDIRKTMVEYYKSQNQEEKKSA